MRVKKNYRIPTLLVLFLLTIFLGIGIYLYSYQQKQTSQVRKAYSPQKITLVNLTDNQASISWQTQQDLAGEILIGETSGFLKSNPHLKESAPKQNHLIVAKNLKPLTKYYYQINIGGQIYPQKPLEFKTGPKLLSQNNSSDFYKPIRGTVLDLSYQPLDNALVVFEAPGAAKLATLTTVAGNFILPTAEVRSQDLLRRVDLSQENKATLIITKNDLTSIVKIKLPPEKSLPSFILGQNLDLTTYNAPSTTPVDFTQNNPPSSDINNDGKINTLDLSMVRQGIEKNKYEKKLDLNEDGKVDKNDFDLVRQALQK